MIRGCRVPDAEVLSEAWERRDERFFADVHAERMDEVFRSFLRRQTEEMFFYLELPSRLDGEENLWKKLKRRGRESKSPLHKDVYYLDGLDVPGALSLLDCCGERLIQDGLCSFGFGVRSFSAELGKEKYNMLVLWSKTPERYEPFFSDFGIPMEEYFTTA